MKLWCKVVPVVLALGLVLMGLLLPAGAAPPAASATTARTNLGLGSAATAASGDFAPAVHSHAGLSTTIPAGSLWGGQGSGVPTPVAIGSGLALAGGTLSATGGGGGSAPAVLSVCQGRLTLASGDPLPTADQTGKGTVYWTPYHGNQVALFDGTDWPIRTFAEIAISLATGHAANTAYDLYLYWDGSACALEAVAWPDLATPPARATQDGVIVRSGAPTRRLVGGYRTTTATATEDSTARRLVSSLDRPEPRLLAIAPTGTGGYAYTGASLRPLNDDPANRVEVFACLPGREITLVSILEAVGSAVGNAGRGDWGEDSTSAALAGVIWNWGYAYTTTTGTASRVQLMHLVPVGAHYYQWLEAAYAPAGTVTFYPIAARGTVRN